jgi:peptide/nickel transport system permease protein
MAKTKEKPPFKVKKPSHEVYKRLFRNPPAVIGLVIIAISFIITFLGYAIMPSKVPYGNEQIQEISKQPAGFSVQIIKDRINKKATERNFLWVMMWGQESPYRLHAITNMRIDETKLELHLEMFGTNTKKVLELVDVVLPLHVGSSDKMKSKNSYEIQGDKIEYVDLDENYHTITKAELIKKFRNEYVEKRYYWLGTDTFGRDNLSRLLFGTRVSLTVGFVSVFISILVGVTLGALAGFFGGRTDAFILWFMTVIWSIPGIMLVIAISLALGRGVVVAFIAIGLTSWVEIARMVRGQIMSLKEKPFIEASKALGMKNHYIIIRHILPNIFGPLVVLMTSNFANAILTEAGLSFLGLSVQSPMTSWGAMVSEGFKHITSESGFYLVMYPSTCIGLMVLAFNLLGNGLRDAYDPRTT